jgi:hypothetical protein
MKFCTLRVAFGVGILPILPARSLSGLQKASGARSMPPEHSGVSAEYRHPGAIVLFGPPVPPLVLFA